LHVGSPIWLRLARRADITAVTHLPLISAVVPGPGSARVRVVVLVASAADRPLDLVRLSVKRRWRRRLDLPKEQFR